MCFAPSLTRPASAAARVTASMNSLVEPAVGVFGYRLLVELASVRRPQLLGQFPALQIQVARFGGGGGDGNLVGGGRPGIYP